MHQETSGDEGGRMKRWIEAVRGNRRLELILYGGILLVVILLYSASLASGRGKTEKAEKQEPESASVDSETDVEERLCSVLSSIRGAGRVEVMITYETGTEVVPAMSTRTDSNTAETSDSGKSSLTVQVNEVSEPATMGGSGGNEPIVLLTRQPVVRGVIVVAEGAADIKVKLDLQRAVRAVLDIPLSNIEVFERTYNQEGG